MLQQPAQIQSKRVGSPAVSAGVPVEIQARHLHILLARIPKHRGLTRVPITIQIFRRRAQILDHTAEHIVLLNIFQDLVPAGRQGYGNPLEKGSNVTRQAARPLVRLQLNTKIRILAIQQTIPRDVKMHLLLATG